MVTRGEGSPREGRAVRIANPTFFLLSKVALTKRVSVPEFRQIVPLAARPSVIPSGRELRAEKLALSFGPGMNSLVRPREKDG